MYILEGPVRSDGYVWWRITPTEYNVGTDGTGKAITAPAVGYDPQTGWVADGDVMAVWLVPDDPCPSLPIDISDVTLTNASWEVRMACFRGQVLTFRGWWEGGQDTLAIFPTTKGWAASSNADRLEFHLRPGVPVVLPSPNQWIEIVGMFDDPIACPEPQPFCQSTLAITTAMGLGSTPSSAP